MLTAIMTSEEKTRREQANVEKITLYIQVVVINQHPKSPIALKQGIYLRLILRIPL